MHSWNSFMTSKKNGLCNMWMNMIFSKTKKHYYRYSSELNGGIFVSCHQKHLKIAEQLADWLYISTNQFRSMSDNIFCFWKNYVNKCVLYQPCLYTFLLESTIVMTVWFFHLCFRKLNNLLKTKVPYNFCGFLKAWPKFYSYVLF